MRERRDRLVAHALAAHADGPGTVIASSATAVVTTEVLLYGLASERLLVADAVLVRVLSSVD